MKTLLILSVLIGTLLSGGKAPDDNALTGQWGYTGNRPVFMEKTGNDPDGDAIDATLAALGAGRTSLVLTLGADHKGSLRLGSKSVNFVWSYDKGTRELKTAVGPFNLKGYLVQEGNKTVLAYTRTNLFVIIRYLCDSSKKKDIAALGGILDCCKGLSIAFEFERN